MQRSAEHLRQVRSPAWWRARSGGCVELQLLDEGQRRQILEGFNATEQALGQVQLLHGLFEQQVARTPDAVALVCGVDS